MSPYQLVVIENIVTVLAIAAIVLGLYAMGAGGWSGCGFLLLLNLSTYSEKRTQTDTKTSRLPSEDRA